MTDAQVRSPRCYGYTPAGDIVPAEAARLRWIAGELLSGRHRLQSMVDHLNAIGVPTAGGGQWHNTSLRRLLANPRLSGQAPKNRRTRAPSPAILDPDEQRLLLGGGPRRPRIAPLAAQAPRLLSGLVHCAGEGHRMETSALARSGPVYKCSSGHAQINAGPLEAYVQEMALTALQAGRRPVPLEDASGLAAEAGNLRRWREQISADRRAGRLSGREADRLHDRARRRQHKIAARLDALHAASPLAIPDRYQLDGWWAGLDAVGRRRVIVGLYERVLIGAPTTTNGAGGGPFDSARVQLRARRAPAPRTRVRMPAAVAS